MDRQLSVAIVTPGTFAIPAAKSSSVELVVEQLARKAGSQVKLTVFGKKTRSFPAREVIDKVTYLRPLIGKGGPLTYIGKVSRKLAQLKPDLIQVENRPLFVRFLRKRHPKARIWLSLHSLTFVSKPYISAAAVRSCLRAADRIVVNSEYLRGELIALSPKVRSKVTVNYLGVDAEAFASRWIRPGSDYRQQMLDSYGWQGRRIVLYAGRWVEQKGIHHLLRAMPDIIGQVPETMLVVIGGAGYGSNRITPYVRTMHRLAARFPNHVRFIPFTPHHEMAAWYRLADVLVVPSIAKEAFGLVNLEAMATGVPVVGTRVGGMSEVIQDGVTGLLINPGNPHNELVKWITRLLRDEELRRSMGEQGMRRVSDLFTWDRMAERWTSLVRENCGLQ